MAAGAAGLTQVLTAAEIDRLNALGDRLRNRLNDPLERGQRRSLAFTVEKNGLVDGLVGTRDRSRRWPLSRLTM